MIFSYQEIGPCRPESDFSYFARFDVLERYLDERLNTLLSDDDIADEWDEVALELEELVPAENDRT